MQLSFKIYQGKSHITGWKYKNERVLKERDNFTLSCRNNKNIWKPSWDIFNWNWELKSTTMLKVFMKPFWLFSLPILRLLLTLLFSMLSSLSSISEMFNFLKKCLKITFTLHLITSIFSWTTFNFLSTMSNIKKTPKMPNKFMRISSILWRLDSPELFKIHPKSIKR